MTTVWAQAFEDFARLILRQAGFFVVTFEEKLELDVMLVALDSGAELSPRQISILDHVISRENTSTPIAASCGSLHSASSWCSTCGA